MGLPGASVLVLNNEAEASICLPCQHESAKDTSLRRRPRSEIRDLFRRRRDVDIRELIRTRERRKDIWGWVRSELDAGRGHRGVSDREKGGCLKI